VSLRLFVGQALAEGREVELPEAAARHAQVRRVQPGDRLTVFDGSGLEWPAQVASMGRRSVRVLPGAPVAVDREARVAVSLAVAVPANERMDALVEKASELGVTAIQPLLSERSVLRLEGARAQRRREHWQSIAIAACEQCGRARVPDVRALRALDEWLGAPPEAGARWALSLAGDAHAVATLPRPASVVLLSGPEGGLSQAEQAAALGAGFVPVGLGPRVLRADTAPLAALAWLTLNAPPR
jgi:16S rRNA (uracil1498-N3)-methyltransferase